MSKSSLIHNPILRGFNPDPSIIRVNDDYYIATSTFEWFPGVQIHHSRDLVHWELLTHPLTRVSQLDMMGDPDSGGIWAPCLSYCDGLFYLIYTDVKTLAFPELDCHNYLITAPDIMGPWSEPLYLNSSGFDASLYHDDQGRKWLLNMILDHRKGKNAFSGIVLQEYDPREEKLVGEVKNIFRGTSLGCTEGPHIYKRDGYYYLLTAEGGTSYAHAVTMARSATIEGPYQVDPTNPILTSAKDASLPLQKAGHASLVQTREGEWYLAHLCSRPLGEDRRCMLGRETALQRCHWTNDGWLRVDNPAHTPDLEVSAPALPPCVFEGPPQRDEFEDVQLSKHYASLRVPVDESWLSLSARPGFLRIHGRETLVSHHRQSMLARRIQSFKVTAETCVEFEPQHHQHMAGLICYYNTRNHYYLRISYDEARGKTLGILARDKGVVDQPLREEVSLPEGQRCFLRVCIDQADLRFFYSLDGNAWQPIGEVLDASKLSDDYDDGCWGFTGAFVGLCVQDLSGGGHHADFDYLDYMEA
jgi:xylan 1,4-beta-xylosidase